MGTIIGIAFIGFMIAHLALDLRSQLNNIRKLHHSQGGAHRASIERNGVTYTCEHCQTVILGHKQLQHEILWTVSGMVVLSIHILLDFIA